MIKNCGEPLLKETYNLIFKIWITEQIPKEWTTAIL